MALWLVRAGKYGEHEARFLNDEAIYFTWEEFSGLDLSLASSVYRLKEIVSEALPDRSNVSRGIVNGQANSFVLGMHPGDIVVVPRKSKASLAFGEVIGDYRYDQTADSLYRHSRSVRWINIDVPRSLMDEDIRYSFGSLLTISRIQRNDAEKRIRALIGNGFKEMKPVMAYTASITDEDEVGDGAVDLEQLARDHIAKLVIAKFKGKKMERLVAAILKAQGYFTFESPEGADKGVDILAGSGPLGFDRPRICVQVKSTDAPVDHPTLSQLIGTMQTVQADQGLLVSWGGFKPTVERETPNQFFRVRFWDQNELIEQLLEHYHKLDADIRAELPLKRIWTVAEQDIGG